MPIDSGAFIEPVLEQILKLRVAVGQREQAIARVARWENTELVPEPSRASTIIGDRDDPGDRRDIPLALFRGKLRETFENRRQSRPASQRNDPMRTGDVQRLHRGQVGVGPLSPMSSVV